MFFVAAFLATTILTACGSDGTVEEQKPDVPVTPDKPDTPDTPGASVPTITVLQSESCVF